MTGSDGYRVGYKRPPLKTRWKKGQSGNPKHRKPKSSESTVAMIDRLLIEPIHVVLNGENKRVTKIQAIVLRLLQKEIAGDERASRVLQKYVSFAAQNSEKLFDLTFVDSDYTRALVRKLSSHGDG